MCQIVDSIILRDITERYKKVFIFEDMGYEKFWEKLYNLLHSK